MNHLKPYVLGISLLSIATCIIILIVYHHFPHYYPYALLYEADLQQIECVYLNGVEKDVGIYKTMNQEGWSLLLEMLNSIGTYNRKATYSGNYTFPMGEYYFQITYLDGHVLQICTEIHPKPLIRINGCGFPVDTNNQPMLETIEQLWARICIQNDPSLIEN